MRKLTLFLVAAAPFYILTNISNFSTSLPMFIFCFLFVCLLFFCFTMAIPKGVRWYLIVVLTSFLWWLAMVSIFLYTCWPFVCFHWRNVFLSSFHFWKSNYLGFFKLLSCRSYLHILDIIPLSDLWLEKVFSHSVDCLFTLLSVAFVAQDFLFHESHLSIFVFVACAFGVISKKLLTKPMLWNFLPNFF